MSDVEAKDRGIRISQFCQMVRHLCVYEDIVVQENESDYVLLRLPCNV